LTTPASSIHDKYDRPDHPIHDISPIFGRNG